MFSRWRKNIYFEYCGTFAVSLILRHQNKEHLKQSKMKFLNYLAIAAVALCTVSCDDDDDPVNNEVVAPSELIAGSYEGSMTMMGSPMDMALEMKAQSNGKVTIVVPEFKAMGGKVTMPSMQLVDVNVAKGAKEGEFTISKEAFALEVPGMPLVNKKGLKGSVKGEALELAFDITPGGMPMAIDLEYKGNKK